MNKLTKNTHDPYFFKPKNIIINVLKYLSFIQLKRNTHESTETI